MDDPLNHSTVRIDSLSLTAADCELLCPLVGGGYWNMFDPHSRIGAVLQRCSVRHDEEQEVVQQPRTKTAAGRKGAAGRAGEGGGGGRGSEPEPEPGAGVRPRRIVLRCALDTCGPRALKRAPWMSERACVRQNRTCGVHV